MDYLLHLEKSSNMKIFAQNELATALKHCSVAREEWSNARFSEDETDSQSIHSAMDLLMDNGVFGATTIPTQQEDSTIARALELVCCAASRRERAKPVVPNGYYGYDGGKVKPDCVEVAVRELIDLLLWNEETASFEVNRLPPTARPELLALYQIPSSIVSTNYSTDTVPEGVDFVDEAEDRDDASLVCAAVAGDGKDWFEMLSNMPECDYLSTSPHGKPYELTPTLSNMTKVVQQLLFPHHEQEKWTSLQDLQHFWTADRLNIELDTFTERAKMSQELLVHQVATIHVEGSTNAIEMRLRCDWERNTGFATVTHMKLQQERELLGQDQQDKLLQSLELHSHETDQSWLVPFSLCFLSAYGITRSSRNHTSDSLPLHLISSLYGADRRGLMQISATSDLEREDRAFQKALRESQDMLKAAVTKLCKGLSSGENSEQAVCHAELLGWILCQKPNVTMTTNNSLPDSKSASYDSNVEQSLLSLPPEIVLDSPAIQLGLARNRWMCRGKLLNKYAQWRNGKASRWDVVQSLGVGEIFSFLVWALGSGRS